MEKNEFRVLIKHYFIREKSIKETEEKLRKCYGDSAPSHGMVQKWFTKFRCGRKSTSDAERPGRPKEVTTQDMIDKVHDIVLADRRLKVREISEALNISVGCTWNILHECLGMKKLSARWARWAKWARSGPGDAPIPTLPPLPLCPPPTPILH